MGFGAAAFTRFASEGWWARHQPRYVSGPLWLDRACRRWHALRRLIRKTGSALR
jgi:hypothetical protein